MFLFFFIKEKNCIRWTQQIYFLAVYGSFIAQLVEYCSANADFRWSSEMFFFRAFIAITTSIVIPSCILIHSLLVTERPLSACNHCSSRSWTVYILQAPVQVTFNVSKKNHTWPESTLWRRPIEKLLTVQQWRKTKSFNGWRNETSNLESPRTKIKIRLLLFCCMLLFFL